MHQYNTFIGMDLGDKVSHYAIMIQADTEIQSTGTVRTTPEALQQLFKGMAGCCVAIEAGTHSPWISRLLTDCGHKVVVANPRRTRAIYDNPTKNDRVDAEMLARLLRSDPHLLSPIEHVPEQVQSHLAIVKARDALVRVRTTLINTVRGLVKSMGHRLPKVSSDAFVHAVADAFPACLQDALTPLLEQISQLTCAIHAYEKKLSSLATHDYPECAILQSIPGVGPLTAITFRLVIGDPHRFDCSRDIGAYFGLTRKQDQSGAHDPELSITKAGNGMMRRLLVGCAQYIVGPLNNTDSELRQWGLKHIGPPRSDGKYDRKAKKRTIIAVARKVAVLLHTLWLSGAFYEPFYHQQKKEAKPHES